MKKQEQEIQPHQPDLPGAGDGADGCFSSVEPHKLQNLKLVVDIGGRRSIEIPLSGSLILQSSGGGAGSTSPPAVTKGDQDYMENMRGYLLTVATLFVGMAFQAAIQPPSWMPSGKDMVDALLNRRGKQIPKSTVFYTQLFVAFNAGFFSTSLALVLSLLSRMTKMVMGTVVFAELTFLVFCVIVNFSLYISDDWRVWGSYCCIMMLLAAYTLLLLLSADVVLSLLQRVKSAFRRLRALLKPKADTSSTTHGGMDA